MAHSKITTHRKGSDSFTVTKSVVVGRIELDEFGELNPIEAAMSLIASDIRDSYTNDGMEYTDYRFPVPGTTHTLRVGIGTEPDA